MQKPNYEAIIEHLAYGTPHPFTEIELVIITAFQEYHKKHPGSTDGSVVLEEFDTITPEHGRKKYWNRMIIAEKGRSYGIEQQEVKPTPTEAVVIPFPSNYSTYNDAHDRTVAEVRRLGKSAEDIMSPDYIDQLLHGEFKKTQDHY